MPNFTKHLKLGHFCGLQHWLRSPFVGQYQVETTFQITIHCCVFVKILMLLVSLSVCDNVEKNDERMISEWPWQGDRMMWWQQGNGMDIESRTCKYFALKRTRSKYFAGRVVNMLPHFSLPRSGIEMFCSLRQGWFNISHWLKLGIYSFVTDI